MILLVKARWIQCIPGRSTGTKQGQEHTHEHPVLTPTLPGKLEQTPTPQWRWFKPAALDAWAMVGTQLISTARLFSVYLFRDSLGRSCMLASQGIPVG